MSKADPVLQVSDLRIAAGEISLVDGVSLEVGAREVVALVGESGSGKSLSALAVMGLLAPALTRESGDIVFAGENIAAFGEEQMRPLRGAALSMIFQEPISSLNPLAKVGSQVAESLVVHNIADPAEAWRQAIKMLGEVGIPDPEKRARQFPAELSGGMCQRVMIASALISRPQLLIADEPTTALDVTIQAQILALIGDLRDRYETSVLLITHDMGVVAELADRVCVMYGGRIVEQGTVDEIFYNPRHPYTKLLLATIPRLTDAPKSELFAISGNVPSARDWPSGCRFRTRCDLASDRCAQRPELEGMDGHLAACWHSDRIGELG